RASRRRPRARARGEPGTGIARPHRLDVLDCLAYEDAAAHGRSAGFAHRLLLRGHLSPPARPRRRDRALGFRDRVPVARARARRHRPTGRNARGRPGGTRRRVERTRMTVRRDPSKLLLVGFLGLLIVSMVQVAWWITDHLQYTDTVQQRIVALYHADANVVGAILRGRTIENLDEIMPHLEIDPAANDAQVRPSALEALESESARRSNRYLWEGAFFLAVLIGGMAVLTRTIRHEAALRRR